MGRRGVDWWFRSRETGKHQDIGIVAKPLAPTWARSNVEARDALLRAIEAAQRMQAG